MVRLHDHDVAFADALADVLRRVAEIGEPGERAAQREKIALVPGRETKTHRLLRIVRHRETLHLEVAETKPRARLENLPVGPVLEAARYGKPVVASGSETGAGVLLPGKTGLLLDDPGPDSLAAALRLLVDDPDLRRRLGEAAEEHAREKFDPAQNARAVERVYDELLGLRGGPEPAVSEPVAA